MKFIFLIHKAIDYTWYKSWLFARYFRPTDKENGPLSSLSILQTLWDDDILGTFFIPPIYFCWFYFKLIISSMLSVFKSLTFRF